MTIETQEDAPAGAVEVASEVVDAAPKTASEIALVDPLRKIEATLDLLKQEHEAADWDVNTPKGEEAAREFRRKCVKLRTSTDELYETNNAPLLASQRKARELVKKIKEFIDPIESSWDAKITAKEQRKAAEKKAREEAEAARVAGIRVKIATIGQTVVSVAAGTAQQVAEALDGLKEAPTEAEFAEFVDEAVAVWTKACRDLGALRSAAEAREAEERQLAEQREQLRLAEEKAEQERQAAARRTAERNRLISLVTSATLSSIGKPAEQITKAIEGLAAIRSDVEALADADVTLAATSALEQLTAMRDATAEAERARAAENERIRLQNEETNAQFRKLEQQKREQADREAEHKRQTDAFEAERQAAIAAANAEKKDVQEGAEAELNALAAAADPVAEAPSPAEAPAAANESQAEPLVDQPAPVVAPATVNAASYPTFAQIVAAVAAAFGVTDQVALGWINNYANIKEIAA